MSFEMKPEISSKNFIAFWSRVNEHTKSFVSGHHYGTYKAATKDNMDRKLMQNS